MYREVAHGEVDVTHLAVDEVVERIISMRRERPGC